MLPMKSWLLNDLRKSPWVGFCSSYSGRNALVNQQNINVERNEWLMGTNVSGVSCHPGTPTVAI